MSTQPSPTSIEQSHQISSMGGALKMALTIIRAFPHLPATSLSATSREITIYLYDADADAFPQWVEALGLEAWKPFSYEYAGAARQSRMAAGELAKVRVYVQANANAGAVAA